MVRVAFCKATPTCPPQLCLSDISSACAAGRRSGGEREVDWYGPPHNACAAQVLRKWWELQDRGASEVQLWRICGKLVDE